MSSPPVLPSSEASLLVRTSFDDDAAAWASLANLDWADFTEDTDGGVYREP